MAVRIRMKRLGRKNRPFYRICIMDQRAARDAEAIEEIGTYDPSVPDKAKRVVLNLERVDHWMKVGAQPSDKVAVLIKKIRTNSWTSAKPPAPLTPPKVKAIPAPEAEAAEAPAEG